jgi:hypothetical protein
MIRSWLLLAEAEPGRARHAAEAAHARTVSKVVRLIVERD